MGHRSHAHDTVPAGLDMPPIDWQHTPPGVQTLIVTWLQRLEAREARLQQDAPTSYRPPSADSPSQTAWQAGKCAGFVLTTSRLTSHDRIAKSLCASRVLVASGGSVGELAGVFCGTLAGYSAAKSGHMSPHDPTPASPTTAIITYWCVLGHLVVYGWPLPSNPRISRDLPAYASWRFALGRRSPTATPDCTAQTRRALSAAASSAHGCQTALTIATIPVLTVAGRWLHACTTVARSSGMCDTHRTHFSCTHVSLGCSDRSSSCWSTGGEAPPSVVICWGFVLDRSCSCCSVKVEAAGIEPAAAPLPDHAFPSMLAREWCLACHTTRLNLSTLRCGQCFTCSL
jgi:hypothetical protein